MAGWQGHTNSLKFSNFQTTIKSHDQATGASKLATLNISPCSFNFRQPFCTTTYFFMIDMVSFGHVTLSWKEPIAKSDHHLISH